MRRRNLQKSRMFAGGSPCPVVEHTHTTSGAVGSCVTSKRSMDRQCTDPASSPPLAASRAMRSATSRAFPVSDPYRTRSGSAADAMVTTHDRRAPVG